MTAFVLGATGFVGREVVRQLCVRGGKPIAHVRPDSSKLATWKQTFGELGATVDASPWKVAALATSLREFRASELYILIGTTRAKAKSDQVSGDPNVDAMSSCGSSRPRARGDARLAARRDRLWRFGVI